MSECWISPELTPSLEATDAESLFSFFDLLEGEVSREVASRRTLKVVINGRPFFLKIHFGVGWSEIIKNLVQFRLPVLGARNEWLALQRLHEAEVPTMTTAAFVELGSNPAAMRSAILTEALENRTSLEFYDPIDIDEKRRLIEQIAVMTRRMHRAGVNHRDYYICHFLMLDEDHDDLKVIDLHRAQIRQTVPDRWLIKDLGGLLFSAVDKRLTRRDLLRFIRTYHDAPLREVLNKNPGFWPRVMSRARRLYLQDHGDLPERVAALLK